MIHEINRGNFNNVLGACGVGMPRHVLPLRFVTSAPTESLQALAIRQIRETVVEGKGNAFLLKSADGVRAIAGISLQIWESGVLNVPSYTLTVLNASGLQGDTGGQLSELIKHAVRSVFGAERPSMISIKCWSSDSDLLCSLESNNFQIVDTFVDATCDMIGVTPSGIEDCADHNGISIRVAIPEDESSLGDLAERAFSGHFGRFHADERIGRDAATRVYREWISSSMRGWADVVFVAVDSSDGQVAGFSVWNRPSEAEKEQQINLGHYSLGAVCPQFSGRGIFKRLTLAGMNFLNDCDVIEGPTHIRNVAVQKGYTSLGWRLVDKRHTLHAWID